VCSACCMIMCSERVLRNLHSFPTRRSSDLLRFVKPQEKRPAEFDIAASLAETLDLLRNSPELGAAHTIEDDIAPPSNIIVGDAEDRKSTRLNSSHDQISYAVFCLKKKNNTS